MFSPNLGINKECPSGERLTINLLHVVFVLCLIKEYMKIARCTYASYRDQHGGVNHPLVRNDKSKIRKMIKNARHIL